MPSGLPSWDFHNSTAIHFGIRSREKLVEPLTGKRILAVSSARGREQFEHDPILGSIEAHIDWIADVATNPGLRDTQNQINQFTGRSFDAVLAFGGGSAIDAAKAIAIALPIHQQCKDLATLIRDPSHNRIAPLPIHAVSTTSGTGAEVTPFATIWDHENHKKLSLFSPFLYPVSAIIDPELTLDLPRDPTISTGLDALSHAFESAWNKNRSPLTLLMAGRAISLGLAGLPRLAKNLGDIEARVMMSEVSLLAGLCISQTRTALAHSISYPLTAHFGIPHGFACAYSMAAIGRYIQEEAPQELEELARYANFETSERLVSALEDLLRQLGISDLLSKATGSKEAILGLRSEMITPGRSDNFILPVNDALLERIITIS